MDTVVHISSASVSDRGLSKKRPHNEDSYLELGQRGIFAVADGVGGAQAGEVASQMAMDILGEAFANAGNGDAETVMRAAIERANTAIHDMAQELPQLSSMATTIVALHLNGNIATIGHVGDSRLYRLDRDGELHRETEDHSMVAEEVRAGRMTEEQAENHPSRNIISRALGAESTVEPDLKTIMVEAGTAFLLCSDGITRHVNDQEIKGVLTFGGSPEDVCEYLKNLCFERGAEDNLTAVVLRLGSQAVEVDTASPDTPEPVETPTAATARKAASPPADDNLLELETGQLAPQPTAEADVEAEHETISLTPEEKTAAVAAATVLKAEVPPTVPSFRHEPEPTAAVKSVRPASSAGGKVMIGLAMLALGILIGGAASYLVLKSRQAEAPPRPTEMRSGNAPLTAFEENRRTVDQMPAAALAGFGADPQTAEDYFLVGRAHVLLNQYVEAKNAFDRSRQLLVSGQPDAFDPNNARTLEIEIAIAMAALNNTTGHTLLRNQLEKVTKRVEPTNINSATPVR
ncbi:MAG: protein phosphatase 2C domain-containing protein [Pyrinomonadaceae bacterium]|nr:protein phosphatase 2C domain-containing protein [Pyrinomonadaceae bacterium]